MALYLFCAGNKHVWFDVAGISEYLRGLYYELTEIQHIGLGDCLFQNYCCSDFRGNISFWSYRVIVLQNDVVQMNDSDFLINTSKINVYMGRVSSVFVHNSFT